MVQGIMLFEVLLATGALISGVVKSQLQYTRYDNGVYIGVKVVSGGSSISWQDANDYCESEIGTELGSIHSLVDNDDAVDAGEQAGGTTGPGIWIGLHDMDNEDVFIWDDSTALDYTNWNDGEPNDYGNNGEDCVHLRSFNGFDGKWNDRPCDATTIDLFVCNVPDITEYNNGAYIGVKYGTGSSSISWQEANDYCASQFGTELGSIHSLAANNDAVDAGQRAGGTTGDGIWIGLNDLDTENDFVWEDGTAVNYENWNAGEPNNQGGEDCVHLRARNQFDGKWNDRPCDTTTTIDLFVCNVPTDKPTTKPTDWPTFRPSDWPTDEPIYDP